MYFLRKLKNKIDKSAFHHIPDHQLNELSKTILFRKLSYKESMAVKVFDFRDISDKNPNNNLMLTCEHASNNIHKYYLGEQKHFLDGQDGYDMGAKDMCLELSEKIKVLSIHSNFSKLIIDPNKSLLSKELIIQYLGWMEELIFNKKGQTYLFRNIR